MSLYSTPIGDKLYKPCNLTLNNNASAVPQKVAIMHRNHIKPYDFCAAIRRFCVVKHFEVPVAESLH